MIPFFPFQAGNEAALTVKSPVSTGISFLTYIPDTTDASSYSGGSWNNISLGTPAANRKIVIGIGCRSGSVIDFSSGSVGSASLTAIGSAGVRGTNLARFVIADNTDDVIANISLAFSATAVRIAVGVWAIYGASSSTPERAAASVVDPPTSGALVLSAGSLSLGIAYVGAATAVSSFTNLTKDFETIVESAGTIAGGELVSGAGGSTTMTMNFNNNANCAGSFASWAVA